MPSVADRGRVSTALQRKCAAFRRVGRETKSEPSALGGCVGTSSLASIRTDVRVDCGLPPPPPREHPTESRGFPMEDRVHAADSIPEPQHTRTGAAPLAYLRRRFVIRSRAGRRCSSPSSLKLVSVKQPQHDSDDQHDELVNRPGNRQQPARTGPAHWPWDASIPHNEAGGSN